MYFGPIGDELLAWLLLRAVGEGGKVRAGCMLADRRIHRALLNRRAAHGESAHLRR